MTLQTWLPGLLPVLGTPLLGVIGLFLVRRYVDKSALVAGHEVGGYFLSVVGTLYAVLLGLVVVDAMNRYQQARQTAEQEANALADIVLLSETMGDEARREPCLRAAEYVRAVVGREWDAMNRGHADPQTRQAAARFVLTLSRYEPQTEGQKAVLSAQLDAVRQFWDSRRVRVAIASHGMPTLEWLVLIVGAAVTILFTYFFSIEHAGLQTLMTSLMCLIIGLNIALVMMFGYPFAGPLRVPPDTFRIAHQIILEHGARHSLP